MYMTVFVTYHYWNDAWFTSRRFIIVLLFTWEIIAHVTIFKIITAYHTSIIMKRTFCKLLSNILQCCFFVSLISLFPSSCFFSTKCLPGNLNISSSCSWKSWWGVRCTEEVFLILSDLHLIFLLLHFFSNRFGPNFNAFVGIINIEMNNFHSLLHVIYCHSFMVLISNAFMTQIKPLRISI